MKKNISVLKFMEQLCSYFPLTHAKYGWIDEKAAISFMSLFNEVSNRVRGRSPTSASFDVAEVFTDLFFSPYPAMSKYRFNWVTMEQDMAQYSEEIAAYPLNDFEQRFIEDVIRYGQSAEMALSTTTQPYVWDADSYRGQNRWKLLIDHIAPQMTQEKPKRPTMAGVVSGTSSVFFTNGRPPGEAPYWNSLPTEADPYAHDQATLAGIGSSIVAP